MPSHLSRTERIGLFAEKRKAQRRQIKQWKLGGAWESIKNSLKGKSDFKMILIYGEYCQSMCYHTNSQLCNFQLRVEKNSSDGAYLILEQIFSFIL